MLLAFLFYTLNIIGGLLDATVIYHDNTTATAYAKYPKYHVKSKLIDTRYRFIRDIIIQDLAVLKHISKSDITKLIARDAF